MQYYINVGFTKKEYDKLEVALLQALEYLREGVEFELKEYAYDKKFVDIWLVSWYKTMPEKVEFIGNGGGLELIPFQDAIDRLSVLEKQSQQELYK